jgi:hypothetical protein
MVQSRARARADFVRLHRQALQIGSEVTRWFRKQQEPNVLKVTPENVLATLEQAAISCVLMGAHGINVYRDEPRASQDVDVLVTKREVRKAVRVLEETFPYLEIKENSVVACFINPVTQKGVIDVMKPTTQGIQMVFRNTVRVGDGYRIPDLEMAIVLKFMAILSPGRRVDKRVLDIADFTNMVLTNRHAMDMGKARRLAGRARTGGAARIDEMIADVDAGRVIQP